jgi:phage terminase large subunit-like protein
LSQQRKPTAVGAHRKAPPYAARRARNTPSAQSASAAWRAIAHAAQLPPTQPWSTWLFQGGRGAGKTRAGAEWLAARAEATPNGVFALVGPTQHDVREVMIDGVSGLRSLPNRAALRFEASRQRLVWPNGAVAYAFSAQEPERLRGPQFEAAWADEFCVWPKPAETLANLRLALRRGANPQLVVTTTPKPILSLRKLRAEPHCLTTQAPTTLNAAHLSPAFLAHVTALYGGTRLAAQELEGLVVDAEGALFTAELFVRAPAPARFDRIVVAVDPPAGRNGSACGIVVAARSSDTHSFPPPQNGNPRTLEGGKECVSLGYVLEDCSAHGLSPLGWAQRACEAARRWKADAIVAESNQGGEMVRTVLSQAAPPCPVKLVHASVGKRARAEPIALLYEQRRIVHAGALAQLEEELMALGADDEAEPSDRADAAIWALSDLMLTLSLGPRARLL